MSDSRILIPPPCEPISLTDAKLQLRVDLDRTYDDDLILSCIAAARTQTESLTRRQLVMCTSRVTLDAFPGSFGGRSDWGYLGGGIAGAAMAPKAWPNTKLDDAAIVLFGGPLQTVLSITYADSAGNSQTMSASDYVVDAESDPARIMPATGTSWPSTSAQINTVAVTATAGWMTPASYDATANTMTLAAGALALANGMAVNITAITDVPNVQGNLPSPFKARRIYYVVNASGLTFQLALTPGGSAIDFGAPTASSLLIDACPESVRQAARILLTHFYENRGDREAPIPSSVTALLTPWKVWRF